MKNILRSIIGGILFVGVALSTGCKKESGNGGSTSSWTAVGGNGLPSGSFIKSVSARNNVLYALVYTPGADKFSPSDVSVYSSADNGDNWSYTGAWATGVNGNGGSSEIYATENHLFISNGVEFYMNDITCSGAWNMMSPSATEFGSTITASSVSGIFANSTDLYLPYMDNNGNAGLFWSIDDGETFTDIGSHVPNFTTGPISYVTVASAGQYAFGEGVYRKGDLNNYWTRIDQGLPASTALATAYVASDQLFAAQNNTLYKSSDNGYNWKVFGTYPPDAPNTRFGLYYHTDKLLWFDRSGIYATTNGSSWSKFTSGMDLSSESLYTHVFGPAYSESDTYLFVCTNKHIYKLKK